LLPSTLRRCHKGKQVSQHRAAFESKSLLTLWADQDIETGMKAVVDFGAQKEDLMQSLDRQNVAFSGLHWHLCLNMGLASPTSFSKGPFMEVIMYQPPAALRPTSRASRQISSPQPRPAHPVSTSPAFPGNGNGDGLLDENKPPGPQHAFGSFQPAQAFPSVASGPFSANNQFEGSDVKRSFKPECQSPHVIHDMDEKAMKAMVRLS